MIQWNTWKENEQKKKKTFNFGLENHENAVKEPTNKRLMRHTIYIKHK